MRTRELKEIQDQKEKAKLKGTFLNVGQETELRAKAGTPQTGGNDLTF